ARGAVGVQAGLLAEPLHLCRSLVARDRPGVGVLDAVGGVLEHRTELTEPARVHVLRVGHEQRVDRVPVGERRLATRIGVGHAQPLTWSSAASSQRAPSGTMTSRQFGRRTASGERALPGGSAPESAAASASSSIRRALATATSPEERCSLLRSTIGPMLVWTATSSSRRLRPNPVKWPASISARSWPQRVDASPARRV